jgi:hypothetical protein
MFILEIKKSKLRNPKLKLEIINSKLEIINPN